MSTLLINTTGGSKFISSANIVEHGAATDEIEKKNLNIALTNTDGKPELKSIRPVIDVINDFSWYTGPKATSAALDKIPCVFLIEREQLLSSLISGALYYLNASANLLTEVGNSNFLTSVLGKLTESAALDDLSEGAAKGGSFLNSFKANAVTASDRALLSLHNLQSLAGIYFTKETGFKYRLPIYGSPSTNTGEWGASSGGGLIQTLIEGGQKIVDNISSIVNFAQPGVYIEKPQYFQDVKGRTETITFPLINTVRRSKQSPVQQNYELLWLLAFQNKPYKTSFSRTPPPKIYSVTSPGQFSMPYAFISNMDVKFIGTTRNTTVYVPSGNGEGTISPKPITTPVPEAYQVTLTFTSLIGDYGNTMLSNAFTSSLSSNGKVIIGSSK